MYSSVFRFITFFGIGVVIGHFLIEKDWAFFWLTIALGVATSIAFIATAVEDDNR